MTIKIDGINVDYIEASGKVMENGVESKRFKPSFIPNGDNDPDFFGFVDTKTNLHYDTKGHVNKISSESEIKL